MQDADGTRPQNLLLGITLIVTAAFVISAQDVVFKLFSQQLTLWQIFALRGLIATPLLLAINWQRGELKSLVKAALSRWILLRSLCFTATFLAFYAAIPFLSLSTVGAANYIAPIFVTLMTAYLLREPVGPAGWIAVLLGFAGVLVLLQPGTDAFSPWVILPVIGAAFYACAHILTRSKCARASLSAMTLSLAATMTLSGVVISGILAILNLDTSLVAENPYLFGPWSAVSQTDWLVLGVLAVFTLAIGMLLAGAYQAASPAKISVYEYSYLVFVAIWDILVFGLAPTVTSISGMLLIVVAGVIVLHKKSAHE